MRSYHKYADIQNGQKSSHKQIEATPLPSSSGHAKLLRSSGHIKQSYKQTTHLE